MFTRLFFRLLGWGVGILLCGSIAAILVGQIKNYYPSDELMKRAVTIVTNYIYVVSSLIGFGVIHRASLANHQRKTGRPNQNTFIVICLTAVIGLLWAALIFTNASRQISAVPGAAPSFYINDWLIVATIIIPTIVGWFFAVMSALILSDTGPTAVDERRRRQFSRLTIGIWLLLFGFIILNGILSIGAERFMSVGLSGVLIIIYVFVLAVLAAYWGISSSIKNLFLLEEPTTDEPAQ
jgi:hypothetical protein